ncbi:MAG TPA: hypothetical protein VK934_02010 [Fimbriimonas sp.]|nr:hypothetical protein [Fimbriimonas sp.]
MDRFHAHRMTRDLDGQIYIEAMQESGGARDSAVFSLDLASGKPPKSFTAMRSAT